MNAQRTRYNVFTSPRHRANPRYFVCDGGTPLSSHATKAEALAEINRLRTLA